MASQSPPTDLPWTRRTIRAPREDFGLLSEPALPAAVGRARDNHAALTALATKLQGRTVAQLRQWTREEALKAARDYTATLLAATGGKEVGDEGAAAAQPADLLFVAGHQPALFHPGVWVKNFAARELARRSGGLSLNLSVDTDVMGSTRIRVPTGSHENPRIESVPIDADRPRAPWEEDAILDRALFRTFGERVEKVLLPWGARPLIHDFWPLAVRASQRFPLLRDCLVAARGQVERDWGAGNLELPISRLCELDPFLWFAGHVLAHLPRFAAVHNRVLVEYRAVNRVRSRTHPVPELKTKEGWTEGPFWVWRQGDQVRGRLFARQDGREVILSDGRQEFARLPLSPEMDACCAVEVLRELPSQGIRFRPRALMTTLFSRLCLADLFIHGIGGAKYDEMTDRILTRFFGVPVPTFLTMTATLAAGFSEPFAVGRGDEERLVRHLRDLRWNPDRQATFDNNPDAKQLAAEKKNLVAAMNDTSSIPSNYDRFKRIQEIDRRLAEGLADRAASTAAELAQVRKQRGANALLQDREFSFCLYPEERLRRLMASLWPSER